MSCNCCCAATYDLCKSSVCDNLDFGFEAQEEGTYKLLLDFLDAEVILQADLEIDDEVLFDITGLNENMTFTGKLYSPSGKQIILSKDGTNYDCIKFKTAVRVAA